MEDLPSAKEFMHEIVLHYFAAEGRLWRTLKALVLHPGKLTNEYLHGRKLRYVFPLRLYLTISVIFFLLLGLAAAQGGEKVGLAFLSLLNDGHSSIAIIDLGPLHATRHADGSFDCNLPTWLCARIDARVLTPQGELVRRIYRDCQPN